MDYPFKKYLPVILTAVLLSLFSLHFFGNYKMNFEGLELQIETNLSVRGTTQIEVPPLGLVRANTHDTPVKLTIRLANINLEQIQNLLQNNINQRELSRRLEENMRQEARRYVIQLMLMAGAAGLFAAFALRSTRAGDYLLGSVVAMVVVGALLMATYKDFRAEQFANPEYEGALKAAPWMIGVAEEALVKIDTLGNKLKLVADNFNLLYQQIDNLQPLAVTEGNIKVLHVSDIHNNPAALEFIGRMAQLFEVNLIIDTGDISDFGTPLEGLLLERIKDLPVPYVFVAGNHDSPDIKAKMRELKGKVIIANGVVEVNGLRIAGFHDPASRTNQIQSAPPQVEAGQVKQIREILRKLQKPVHIIAVHSPSIARPLAGEAPVLLFGHNHQFSVTEAEGSVLVNAGTSGASGLGTLQEIERRPYSVMLLNFYKDETTTRLLAVDSIQINSLTTEFNLQRHLFDSTKEMGTTPSPLPEQGISKK